MQHGFVSFVAVVDFVVFCGFVLSLCPLKRDSMVLAIKGVLPSNRFKMAATEGVLSLFQTPDLHSPKPLIYGATQPHDERGNIIL
jgi:hypothetical protein